MFGNAAGGALHRFDFDEHRLARFGEHLPLARLFEQRGAYARFEAAQAAAQRRQLPHGVGEGAAHAKAGLVAQPPDITLLDVPPILAQVRPLLRV